MPMRRRRLFQASLLCLLFIACLVYGCSAPQREGPLPPLPSPEPVADAAWLLQADENEYTIAWLSDTQYYSEAYPEIFLSMTRFLYENREALRLQYVVHTGDLVQDYENEQQWAVAKAAMNELRDIPYGVLAGNHDVTKKEKYENFGRYFGSDAFSGSAVYGESYLNNRGHYDLVTIDGKEFVFVYIGYQPSEACVEWVNAVLQAYPGRIGVLLTHDYLDTDSSLRKNGEYLQKNVVRNNPNVFLVLCGHRYNADCIPISFDDTGDGSYDRLVYQCIANYQNKQDLGGGGYIRFLRINEKEKSLRFCTYSPFLAKYYSIHKGATNKTVVMPVPWGYYE